MQPPAHPSVPANPYSAYQPFYSSHYAQAYSQQFLQPYAMPNYTPIPTHNVNRITPWCPPGHSRCTYKECQFTGAPKTLETHMMDRHLIFPPGWDRRPKKPEWDADPSLKGKPVTIQGTNIILDKPEDLEAWLVERKRRWPTTARVEEKKRKIEEAIARGQLLEPLHRTNKRQRVDEGSINQYDRGRVRGRGRGRGIPSRGRGRATDCSWHGRPESSTTSIEVARSAAPAPDPTKETSGPGSEDDDELPEVVSSKLSSAAVSVELPSKPLPIESPGLKRKSDEYRPIERSPPQPRKEPYNPFASHSTLLRNLLLPEIRVTISNLSQAIRFLVDNNFLEGVEVTPGAADTKMIQVIPGDDISKTTSNESPGNTWRGLKIDMLVRIFVIGELKTSELYLRRAHHVLGWIFHFCIHSLPPAALVIIHLLITLLLQVSLIHSDNVLYNWELKTEQSPYQPAPDLDNLRCQTLFTGTTDEEKSCLSSARIELTGVAALELMQVIMDEIFVGDDIAIRRITLPNTSSASPTPFVNSESSFWRSVQGCNPGIFYHHIRPWFRGVDSDPKNCPWVFAGIEADQNLQQPTELSGRSAGQSSLVHALDIFDVDQYSHSDFFYRVIC
ncbi:hypothetical protein C0995_006671 [Termitomyces sp. Mi166|nr:hypothetical protein C0995_006671 [Termitomyces sp. Mi166\